MNVTSSPGMDNNNPRKRQRTACDRCKTRKQRCDNLYPYCSNCAKSGATCSRPPLKQNRRSSYTRALESKVADLESQLLTMVQNQQPRTSDEISPGSQTSSDFPSHWSEHRTPNTEAPSPLTPRTQQSVADVVGILSLGNGNTETLSYIGSSSGYALATDLGRIVQATAWNKALFVPSSFDESGEALPSENSSTRKITLKELQYNRAEPPSEALGAKLIKAYLRRIHPRFPFIFRSDIWTAHRCRYSLGRQDQRHVSSPSPSSYSSKAYESDGFALFVLYMVYAIGALNLRLTEDYRDTSPEQFYVFAMQHVSSVREASSIHNLEATVLLILYHLRSESRNGLWHLTGLAMRTVTDIGLHRAASTHGLPAFETQMRRRLFWSVYSLESILAGTLGRPVSLSDSDIDQPLPASINDDDGMVGISSETLSMAESLEQQALHPTNLTQFILLSQLHVLEARIQRKVYRVDKPTIALIPKMHRLMGDLETWLANVLPTLRPCEHDRILLHYHRNVRLLLQPFLSVLDPSSDLFLKAAEAAGQICQIHKRLHQTPEYGHSFVAVHTAFVSGITLLYILWRGRDKLWSIGISNDIRAASCVLSIMGERAPWIRRFRDTFEVLVEVTMSALQGASDHAESHMNGDNGATAPQADFSLFDHLDFADHGALNMARELTGWMQ